MDSSEVEQNMELTSATECEAAPKLEKENSDLVEIPGTSDGEMPLLTSVYEDGPLEPKQRIIDPNLVVSDIQLELIKKAGFAECKKMFSKRSKVNVGRILTNEAFTSLPLSYQNTLLQLLPKVDVDASTGTLGSSALRNEYFAKACEQWSARAAAGDLMKLLKKKKKKK